VKILLDTNMLIWAAAGMLPKEAVPYIANPGNILFFSAANIWEIVIKKGLGRPDFQLDPDALYHGCLDNGYGELDITSRHVMAVSELPQIHKDPFDRLLLTRARVEGSYLLTSDEKLSSYPGDIIYIP
jgi:PIN domain nuclease of toxin-antitoxin system